MLPWAAIVKLLVLWSCFSSLQMAKSRFERCSVPHTLVVCGQAAAMLCSGTFFAWQVSLAGSLALHCCGLLRGWTS